MTFQIINDKGQVVMTTTSINCGPNEDTLESMSKAGYKFKVDDKLVAKKKAIEITNRKD